MNVKINIHENNSDVARRLDLVDEWSVPASVKQDVKSFVHELSLGKVNKGKRASDRTQVKYISLLKPSLNFLNMQPEKLEIKDIENLEKALVGGKIKNNRVDKPYSRNMIKDIRICLKVFLKWKLGFEKAMKLTDWLDTRDIKKTPDFLKEQEIEILYKNCKSAKERYIIAVLFDVGCRAEEFHNIRYEDIQLPEKENNFVKIALKEEYSKTQGRTVALYWRYSSEAVKDYVQERIREGVKSNDPIFDGTYDSVRFFLRRIGQKLISKKLHFHLFRHSSATYYASKLNRHELCYRYGWKFSSDMPDVYISRAGMENKELDEKFTNTEIGTLKDQLEKQKQQIQISEEKYNTMTAEVEQLKKLLVNLKSA